MMSLSVANASFMSFGFCKRPIQYFGDLNSTIDTMVRFTV